MKKIICNLLTFWYSLKSFLFSGNAIPISGHDFVEVTEFSKDGQKQILKCERCDTKD